MTENQTSLLHLSAKILVVDDDLDMLALYSSLLKSAGYRHVKTTSDPRGVLALYIEYDPDILILDIMMPHLDGLQLLSILQNSAAQSMTLPILVATAYPTSENRYAALSQGAIELLSKPFDCAEFLFRVRNLLQIHLAVRDAQEQSQAIF